MVSTIRNQSLKSLWGSGGPSSNKAVDQLHACCAGYCGLVTVSEDESSIRPASGPSSTRDAISIPGSASDMPEPDTAPQDSPPPPGMQFAEQSANQPAAVTAGYSDNPEASEQLLLKLTSLQTAVELSAAGRHGQQCRIADEAFSTAVQLLEKGQVPPAINLLEVAQAACPADKPQAQARIILLLARCQELAAPQHSTATHAPPAPATPAPLYASRVPAANGIASQPRVSSPKAADGDAQKAEQAFEAGLAALQGYVPRTYSVLTCIPEYLSDLSDQTTRSYAAGVTSKQHPTICKLPESGVRETKQLLLSESRG